MSNSVWVVFIDSPEGGYVHCLCATKEVAERELFKKRDEMVLEYRKDFEAFNDTMYEDMIEALSGDDYKNWKPYPQDHPKIYEQEVLT